MRKSLIVAGVAALALGTTGVAHRPDACSRHRATAQVSPTKAGTKSKPKAVKFKLAVMNNPASKTTARSHGHPPEHAQGQPKGLDAVQGDRRRADRT